MVSFYGLGIFFGSEWGDIFWFDVLRASTHTQSVARYEGVNTLYADKHNKTGRHEHQVGEKWQCEREMLYGHGCGAVWVDIGDGCAAFPSVLFFFPDGRYERYPHMHTESFGVRLFLSLGSLLAVVEISHRVTER